MLRPVGWVDLLLFLFFILYSVEPVDTSLLLHFFGRHGNHELKYDDFFTFMDNLQTEVTFFLP